MRHGAEGPDASPAGGFDLVTLVTDYGPSGGFVGALHAVVDAVVAGRRAVRILDLDHEIPRHDVLLGALRMERSLAYTRPGVHVGVVDPGVGGSRRGIALASGGRVFVGPDNGLLLLAAEAAGELGEAVALESVGLRGRTKTFDGRDLFAPAAAELALGRALSDLGPRLDPAELVRLERPRARRRPDGTLELLVVQVDGFGNVQLAAGATELEDLGPAAVLRRAGAAAGEPLAVQVAETFGDVAEDCPLLLLDSDLALALSVNRGRADELLGGLRVGDRVLAAPGRHEGGLGDR